jgi:2-polyprenyl-3-methyl-5-hydroxy-6-metoxy-1,4-benzoquinol methylase
MTRWGRYTTEVAGRVIAIACEMAGGPGAALEVGCEGGRWSRLLADRGWTMTCTDCDTDALSICQQRIPRATCISVSPDAITLPCDSGSIRLLLCLEVFPVMDSTWFAREASRVLDDQGVLVGITLNRTSLRGMFVRAKKHLVGESGFYPFYTVSYATWRRRIREAGFEIAHERGYCWFPFSRESNSVFVRFFVSLERLLGLDRVPSLSPWVAFVARKSKG